MNILTPGMFLKQTLVVVFVAVLAANYSFAQDEKRMFFVNVSKGKELVGQIIQLSSLKMTTEFGEIDVPLEKIDGIRMHADNNDSAIIAFTNGDIVTGKINVGEIQLKTNWGQAVVKADAIQSVTSTRNARFYSDPGAAGWRYSRGMSQPGIGPQTGRTIIRNGF